MAKISIPNLKTKFETGDRPTQQDYELEDIMAEVSGDKKE